ncbi:anthrone oxygenase family protein [Streptomyces sp. NPDC059708]|uniref:anthrone oxygenase family protein n=1 Tax=Streptomyces sp. NPDC059708 TaxID=3346916 RepID=UPI0036CCDE4A
MTAVLTVLALLGSGITAGVLFCVALSIVPTFLRLPPDRYVEVHRLIGRNYDPTMPLTVLSGAVTDIALAALGQRAAAQVLCGAAAALLLGVSCVSHLANVPLNRAVKALPEGPVPADWPDPRGRWRAWNLLRTGLAVAALAANAAAAVLAH